MIARPEHSGDILEFPIREQVWIVGHVRADAHLRHKRLLLEFLSFVKRNSSDSCKKSTVICYFLHVSHVLSLDEEKAKLVVSDNNFWFSMNSGMTRTLGRKEGRLACLCTIWCNCAQLLHPRWCSGNQC